jgi:hypothetical protein
LSAGETELTQEQVMARIPKLGVSFTSRNTNPGSPLQASAP